MTSSGLFPSFITTGIRTSSQNVIILPRPARKVEQETREGEKELETEMAGGGEKCHVTSRR